MAQYLRFYVKNERPDDFEKNLSLEQKVSAHLNIDNIRIESESCFYIIFGAQTLLEELKGAVHARSGLGHYFRLTFTTPFSTNAVSALKNAGIEGIERIERSTRYSIVINNAKTKLNCQELFDIFGDRMTECEYSEHPNFSKITNRDDYFTIDVLGRDGDTNLRQANASLCLGFDEEDIRFYLKLFREKFCRNPTDVELFDLGQSNSEHSRHWFFRGKLFVDGKERSETLMTSIKKTQKFSNQNNVIAFSDNSSAIRGFPTNILQTTDPCCSSSFTLNKSLRHIIYTAETHNFPTGVSPFPGAATGTGGRIRDVHATGRGAHEIAGIAGYSVGNLYLNDYLMPWEDTSWNYPTNFAHPTKILIEASNGASDYGNKFGEPLICGFARTLGIRFPHLNQRFEYIKPIMFSGGVGAIDDGMVYKKPCEKSQLVAKIGGPVYRIGMGGGSASSVHIQGDRDNEADFGAVQRGDPEMEQKLHRLIRSCAELGNENPITSIHDQGAGGNGNVLKEIVEGQEGGAVIYSDKFILGDPSISVRELWGAEYQESDAILLDPKLVDKIQKISKREKCPLAIVGEVTGTNRVVLKDFNAHQRNTVPVDIDLDVLGDRDPKEFHLDSFENLYAPLVIPENLTILSVLNMVLRLPSVASKRYLTNKVDRSVTGLIAQQQSVGPLHTPVADVAVVALSYWDSVGAAIAVGEQPLKGMICPAIGARMSLGEALTNLVFAPITSLRDVKCSGNWMWAAKLPGEGARLVKACDALCQAMNKLGVAIDGGKDSLRVNDEVVKAPGTLVISAYAPCVDINKVVTPDLKLHDNQPTILLYVPMHGMDELRRLGGTSLAQCLKQIGNVPADLDDTEYFTTAFNCIQKWIVDCELIAGHDVSDGGLIVSILEMAFAGNRGVDIDIQTSNKISDYLSTLFAEELGVVLQIREIESQRLIDYAKNLGLRCYQIGRVASASGVNAQLRIAINHEVLLEDSLIKLREIWEETSDRLELLQTNRNCIKELKEYRLKALDIKYKADFEYGLPKSVSTSAPKVAVIREEGSNGDREMAAAFIMAGFEAVDITMTDLFHSVDCLDSFNGIAFVGGFSYADVLGSAKGWAGSIKFNQKAFAMLKEFRDRKDTFTFGVCNGCQLMALLNWTSKKPLGSEQDIFLDKNLCGRFHSGFTTVKIEKSPAIMLRSMEGSILGVWSSHGEGRFTYHTPRILAEIKQKNLICINYCNGNGEVTEKYPENPNGSVEGVAGICSPDGRHLSLMPHPDRSFLAWQWPNYPDGWQEKQKSPWIKMFENAYDWVLQYAK